MSDDTNSLLSGEYLHLQKVIEDFDQRALTIKAWSVTFSAAGLGLAYSQKQPAILLIAALSAFTFWIVEALWKAAQQAYYQRVGEIERHFDPAGTPTQPFRVTAAWGESWDAHGKFRLALRVMLWPHVMLPHVAVVLAGLALALAYPPTP